MSIISHVNLNLKKVVQNRDKLHELNKQVDSISETVKDIEYLKTQLSIEQTKLIDFENKFENELSDVKNNYATKDELNQLIGDLQTSLEDVIFNTTPRADNLNALNEDNETIKENLQLLIHENELIKNRLDKLERDQTLQPPMMTKAAMDTDKPIVPKIVLKRTVKK